MASENSSALQKEMIKLLTNSDGGLSFKELKKLAFNVAMEMKNPNRTFKNCVSLLTEKGKLAIDDNGLIHLSKLNKKRKRNEESDNNSEHGRESQVDPTSPNGSASVLQKHELWKNGEQMWRDGALDQSYLRTNPDGITRLFCGNLKKDITEEQLRNAIAGIKYIKWMIDKGTKSFYGTTFLEMKDPSAAAAAVLMDKSKLLGRYFGYSTW